MNLQHLGMQIAGLIKIKQQDEDLCFQVAVKDSKPLNCELSVGDFGFDGLKEKRLVLTAEVSTTKASIAKLVETANPFQEPWLAQQNARLSLHEEFISITLPAQADSTVLNHAISMTVEIRKLLERPTAT